MHSQVNKRISHIKHLKDWLWELVDACEGPETLGSAFMQSLGPVVHCNEFDAGIPAKSSLIKTSQQFRLPGFPTL